MLRLPPLFLLLAFGACAQSMGKDALPPPALEMSEAPVMRAGPTFPQQSVAIGKQTTAPAARTGMVTLYYDGTYANVRTPDGGLHPLFLGAARSFTAANIAAVGNAVNTANKAAGVIVWDSTNSRYMRATGATAASTWKTLDGVTTVTPS
jgi:hypothetical protein